MEKLGKAKFRLLLTRNYKRNDILVSGNKTSSGKGEGRGGIGGEKKSNEKIVEMSAILLTLGSHLKKEEKSFPQIKNLMEKRFSLWESKFSAIQMRSSKNFIRDSLCCVAFGRRINKGEVRGGGKVGREGEGMEESKKLLF